MTARPIERGAAPPGTAPQNRRFPHHSADRPKTDQTVVESLQPEISPIDAIVYSAIAQAAERGEPCPNNDLILDLTGWSSLSSPRKVLLRLEKRGLVRNRSFQHGRQVQITSTGHSTAPPRCQATHWRHRAIEQSDGPRPGRIIREHWLREVDHG
jgi:hypothetical protein